MANSIRQSVSYVLNTLCDVCVYGRNKERLKGDVVMRLIM